MAEYYVLLTNAGAARLINAELTGGLVQISQVAVGDGNGAAIVPSETMTALVNEVWRGPVNDVHQHATEANWLVVECVIPEEIGGWTVREIGVFDSNGDLIAIGNLPETYKPVLAEGSGKDLYLRVNLQVGNASVVNLAVDPAIVLATRSYVDDSLAAHALSTNHPDATTEAKGLVELATGSETDLGADSSRALTPLGLANAQRAGQCRLVLDGANLRLIPVDGNKLTVNGIARTIPAAGIALAPTGLSPNTTYYIYAAMV
ncbi:MAG: phage tail protein, partial [Rhodospirillaceae bacterium]